DLVDSTAADQTAAVLAGKVYPLSLGFVGVICGHRGDLQDSARASEERFFGEHPAFKAVAAQCGVRYLGRLLNRILLEKIIEVLPGVRAQALQMTHDVESELQGYGEPLDRQTSGEKGALLLNLFAKFAGQFGDAVEGKLSNQPLEGPVGQLIGRARIDFLFRDVFARTVRNYDCFAGLTDDDIRTALRNATGPRARLFIPEAAFEILVRRQVAKLQAPSLQCAELVFDELQRVLLLSELPEFRRFVRLRDQVFAVVRDILRRCLDPTLTMIRDLVSIEMAYINTSHPDFAASGALQRPGGSAPRDAPAAVPKSDAKVVLPDPVSAADATSAGDAGITSSASSGNLGSGIFSALFRRQSSGGRLQRPGAELATTPSPPNSPGPKARFPSRRSMGGEADARRAREQAADSFGYAPRGGPKLPHVPSTICPSAQEPSEREKVEVSIVKKLLESYLTLVKKNIADSVPKAIMFFLVSGAGISSDPSRVSSLKDAIQSECVTRLYKEELYDSLLCEEGDVKTRRDTCRARLVGLRRVLEVTEQVRDVLDTL
ncbi:DNM1L, partial [Symbiodinium natans]